MGLLGGPTSLDEDYTPPSHELMDAYGVLNDLWKAGCRVEYYLRRDGKWQCEISKDLIRARSIEKNQATAILKANQNLIQKIEGPEIEVFRS